MAIKYGKNARFSFLYKPGAINLQIWIAIRGKAKNKAKKNAIFNSVDVRMDVLPMSPMAVLDSIKQNF